MTTQYPVLDGAEAFFFKGNDVGILISHGFVGTPQSVRFLGEYIAKQGFTVCAVRLKGHGTHYEDMESCLYNDWIQSLEEGYRLLQQHCREIFIIGQSMGGALTAQLASKHQDIAGIILINAAMTSIPVLEEFRGKQEPRFVNEGAPDIKDKSVYEITYSKVPISAIQQLLLLMDDTKEKLPHITCPVLAFKSIEDHVVPPENTDYITEHVSSSIREIVTLQDSYHVASMDYDKELIAETSSAFIQAHSKLQRASATS